MSIGTCVIGIDIGTTSTKAVVFSHAGHPLAKHSVEYPTLNPAPSVSEQDPDEIFQAVLESLAGCLRKGKISGDKVSCISFSSAMHSVIAVDSYGTPLTKSITWADNRSAEWAEKIKNEMNGHQIYERTGTPIHPMSPLSKVVWMRHECCPLFREIHKFISIKEYVFLKLFGCYVVDHSIASATGLFNLEKLDWDQEALDIAGITKDQLSTPVPTTHILKGCKEEYLAYTGLPADTPFVVGASDGVLSNIGADALDAGTVAITIGTSGAIRAVVDEPITDPAGRTFCYALTENHWVIGGPVNNGGMVLRWVRDELAGAEMERAKRLGVDPYDMLLKMASTVSPGSDGLLFHPYMSGERAPLWNAHARGSFFGLSMYHKKEHMIRAVMEGILYNLYSVLLIVEDLTGTPARIQASGGFAQSEFWRQMMADIFGRLVTVPESYESSCLGAAVLGLYALGEVEGIHAVSGMMGTSFTHSPDPGNSDIYRKIMPIYLRLTELYQSEYKAISEFQEKVLESKEPGF